MSLTIHHLQFSQSERLPWLCEELQIPYTLTIHQRDPVLSPQSIYNLNPLGQAPVIQDENLTLAESGACAEYIIHKHGNGRLALPPAHKDYADYLYWFHFANSNLQPHILLLLQLSRVDPPPPSLARSSERFEKLLEALDVRLLHTTWLAGNEFTAADCMTVFSLTTMRTFYPLDLTKYQGILRYLQRVVQREGFRKARARADPDMELMVDGAPPESFFEKLKRAGKV